ALPLRQLPDAIEVRDRGRALPVQVDLDHDVGAAGDWDRLRVSRLHLERLGPGRRLEELHHQARPGSGASARVTLPSMRPYGRSAAWKTSFSFAMPTCERSTTKWCLMAIDIRKPAT